MPVVVEQPTTYFTPGRAAAPARTKGSVDRMPFRAKIFRDLVQSQAVSPARDELLRACDRYKTLTAPQQKARCIRGMMTVLDRSFDEPIRRAVMEACGRRCLGDSVLARALLLQRKARDLNELLIRLNEAHIGGGHLRLEADAIFATYDRCFCGSVSRTTEPFSPTYCQCSCGWFRQLFASLLQRPVEVELLGSIIQGEKTCRFMIRF